jgi:hypothetical protein
MELRPLVYQSAIAAGAAIHSSGTKINFSWQELEVFTQLIIREVARQAVELEGKNLNDE